MSITKICLKIQYLKLNDRNNDGKELVNVCGSETLTMKIREDNTVKKNGFLTISGSSSVTRGSAISLMCNSSGGDSRSRDINWYKEGTKIYSNRDNRILTTKYTSADKVTVSSLRIENSRLEDGGVYVCRTPNKASITIDVKVHNSSGTTVNGTFVKREEHKAGSEQAYRGDNNRIEPTQTTNGQISNSQFTPQLPCFLLLFYLLIYSTEHL
ncbi:protogenin A-like isoform X4 [Octopus vulgaris]|uniref:Protogenin A-like isoform X4 n=1 Tax=Octopus vulgaris TaxID=6645 RepID=A0AA36BAW6_OCTVU|nr:protogenin A-like isoform X4 [Octopus vulgaris]